MTVHTGISLVFSRSELSHFLVVIGEHQDKWGMQHWSEHIWKLCAPN